jgi:uncharacterized protein YjbI with pentapeptide repeats
VQSFPGEPHVNLFTGKAPTSVQCERWLQNLRIDRLHLTVVDYPKRERIEDATEKAGEQFFRGEGLRYRDLNCSDLSFTDLSRTDLRHSSFMGASLRDTGLRAANLSFAVLLGTDLDSAKLQGANLRAAFLQGANLSRTQLQGADLFFAELQGARFRGAHLEGANLSYAKLQGADLSLARLQGADLSFAELQGALLMGAHLEGADLSFAKLQGADLLDAHLDYSILSKVWIWRARNLACGKARVTDLEKDSTISDEIPATPKAISKFIKGSVAEIPDAGVKARATDQIRKALLLDPAKDDTDALAKVWTDCAKSETSMLPLQKFEEKSAEVLRNMICDAAESKSIVEGLIRHWDGAVSMSIPAPLARSLLGQDGKECAAAKYFDKATIAKLSAAATK